MAKGKKPSKREDKKMTGTARTKAKETVRRIAPAHNEAEHKYPFWDPKKEVTETVKLHISVPTYDNTLNLLQDSCVRQALGNSAFGEKLQAQFNFVGSDSLICRARDKMALAFLESDCEWQLQLDNDIIFPYGLGPDLAKFYANWMEEDIFNSFLNEGVFRLALSINAIDEILRSGIQHGKKLVAGLYFWRGGGKNFNEASSLFHLGQSDDDLALEFKVRKDNHLYTNMLATGFLLTHRSVYEGITRAFPELEYQIPQNSPKTTSFAFYNPIVTEETRKTKQGTTEVFRFYRSEDYAFAWRAEQAGFTPCVNMNILLGHMGSHIYSWFDRPMLQKLLFDTYTNPQHHLEKIVDPKDEKPIPA